MYKAASDARQQQAGHVNPFMPPALALNILWPVQTGTADYNAKAIDGVGKVATEWLDFVRRRMGEDVRLATRLTAARSMPEWWGIYADFLQQAVQDYWNEYAAIGRLAGDIVRAPADATEEGREASGEGALRRQAA